MQILRSILIIYLSLFNGVCWEVLKKYPDLYNRDCMVVPENEYSTMLIVGNVSVCPPTYYCWNSHLRTITKANLTWIFNEFRNEQAEKFGIGGMLKVNWHWMLEIDAKNIIQQCPPDNSAILETRDIGGLEAITTKLPSVSHFGCAIIFYQKICLFVCVYCFKESQLSSTSYCPDLYEKNKTSEFPYLCAHKFQKSIYACEPSRLKEYCQSRPEPTYGEKKYDGVLRRMYAVTDGDKFLIYVDGNEKYMKGGVVLRCKEQGGQCAPTLPTWNYVYSNSQMRKMNQSVFFSDNTTYIHYGSYNVKIYIVQAPRTTIFFKASCCSYIFFLLFLTILAIAGVMYYTYLHYKSHQE